ncbi:protein CMSS1 isoform X2 [Benincasa hispida]|uniref:protein CMSS1 isoform X2 n=1 Tax=Benincasa hispida TaxID=102211 RepID=UPI0018FFA83F|nr:protein CMSS1 isoform X2 [Benincasa hispida]
MVGLENADKASEASLRNPRKKRKQRPPNNPKNSKKRKSVVNNNRDAQNANNGSENSASEALPLEPFSFFLDEFQTANDVQISSLEFESMKDRCILGPPESSVQDDKTLVKHIKEAFGSSWKEVLCKGKLFEGKTEPGSPAVLIISTSALRSIELLKGFRSLTEECHAVKLFSKHMKIEEQRGDDNCFHFAIRNNFKLWIWEMKILQITIRGKSTAEFDGLHVQLLKNRVNIASGTPSRIKKLIDTEALGLSRLAVIVLDIQPDIKGYSLFSLPQVRDEFWDLYKSYLHPRVVEGELRICLFGPLQPSRKRRKKELTSPPEQEESEMERM